ncbi:hypothetical protein M422DRAFT_274169, partial [Sphaerobolus stellatus SS14]
MPSSAQAPMARHERPPRSQTPLQHFRDVVRDAMKHYKSEDDSEAHQIFRSQAGHGPRGILPQTVNPDEET